MNLRKSLIAMILSAGLLASSATLTAQQNTTAFITRGTMAVTFNGNFTTQLSGRGVATGYFDDERESSHDNDRDSSPQPVPVFYVEGGVVNRTTGSSEVQTEGGFHFSSAGTIVDMQRLAFESDGTEAARVTAYLVVNGQFIGRRTVFNVTSGSGFAAPIKNGRVQSSPIYFEMDTKFQTDLAALLHTTIDFHGVLGSLVLNVQIASQP